MDGTREVLLVLVAMATVDELAALETTLDEEGREDALAALVGAQMEVQAGIDTYGC